MAVRNFSGSNQWFQCDIGTLNGTQNGAFTFVAVAKVAADGDWYPLIGLFDGTNTGGGRSAWRSGNSNQMHVDTNGDDNFTGVSWTSSDDWVIAAWSKPAGTATLRGHKGVLSSDTWTHNSGDSMDDNSSTVDNLKIGRWSTSNDTWNGRVAAVGIWKRELSDSDIESCRPGLANMLALNPDALVICGDDIEDITGNGADLNTNTGTTVVNDDDPPGFELTVSTPYLREPIISDNNSDPTLVLTTSSAPQVGDTLVLFHSSDLYTVDHLLSPTDADGPWTLSNSVTGGANTAHTKLWTRDVINSGIQTVTLNQGDGGGGENDACQFGWLLVLRTDSDPVAIEANSLNWQGTSSTSHVASTVSGLSDTGLLLTHWISDGATNYSGFPTGLNPLAELDCGSFATSILGWEIFLDGPGATGTRTITSGTSRPYAAGSVYLGFTSLAMASFDVTLALPTINFDADSTVSGTLDVSLPLPTVAFEASRSGTIVQFDVSLNLPSVGFSATSSALATFDVSLPLPEASFNSEANLHTATFNTTLLLPQVSFNALRDLFSTFDVSLSLPTISFSTLTLIGAIRISSVSGPTRLTQPVPNGPHVGSEPLPDGPDIFRVITGPGI